MGGLGEGIVTRAERGSTVEVFGGTVTSQATWPARNAADRLSGGVVIDADVRLGAGSIFEHEQGAGWHVRDAALAAQGEANAAIVFKAADGERASGLWRGLHVSNARDNVLEHVSISEAGGRGWDGGDDSSAGVFIKNDGRLALVEVDIERSGEFSISLRGDSSLGKCVSVSVDGSIVQNRMPVSAQELGCQ